MVELFKKRSVTGGQCSPRPAGASEQSDQANRQCYCGSDSCSGSILSVLLYCVLSKWGLIDLSVKLCPNIPFHAMRAIKINAFWYIYTTCKWRELFAGCFGFMFYDFLHRAISRYVLCSKELRPPWYFKFSSSKMYIIQSTTSRIALLSHSS